MIFNKNGNYMNYQKLFILFAVMSSLPIATHAATESEPESTGVKYFSIAPAADFSEKWTGKISQFYEALNDSSSEKGGGINALQELMETSSDRIFKELLTSGLPPSKAPHFSEFIDYLFIYEVREANKELAILELEGGTWTARPVCHTVLHQILKGETTIIFGGETVKWLDVAQENSPNFQSLLRTLDDEIKEPQLRAQRSRLVSRLGACHLLSGIGQRDRATTEWEGPSVRK